MTEFRAGYNLVERELLGKQFPRYEEVMSIVEFLRKIKQASELPAKFIVSGLDYFLLYAEDRREAGRFLRETVREAGSFLLRYNPVVVFEVERIIQDAEPRLVLDEQDLPLAPVFADRLTQADADYFYAPFAL